MTLKRSLRANKNVLDIGNESGMIEVIDSRTKQKQTQKRFPKAGNKSGRSLVLLITTE